MEAARTWRTYQKVPGQPQLTWSQENTLETRNIQSDYSHNPVQKSLIWKVLEGDRTEGRRWNVL